MSLPEYSELAEKLVVDGDALILFSSSIKRLTTGDDSKNKGGTEEDKERQREELEEVIPVSPGMLEVIRKFENTNKGTWPILMRKVNELVEGYESQMGPQKQQDEEYLPYNILTYQYYLLFS